MTPSPVSPLILVNLIHQDAQTSFHDLVHLLWFQLFRERGEAGHIGKHHRDQFTLPFQSTTGV
jgi:hypothetical protein